MYMKSITDIKKKNLADKRYQKIGSLDDTFATAVLHCVEIIHVESTKALHARYLCVGLLSTQ